MEKVNYRMIDTANITISLKEMAMQGKALEDRFIMIKFLYIVICTNVVLTIDQKIIIIVLIFRPVICLLTTELCDSW